MYILIPIKHSLTSSNNPEMKNKPIIHTHEEAKIYRHYYKPSLNIFRFLRSVLSVIVSGSSPAAHGYDHNRKRAH